MIKRREVEWFELFEKHERSGLSAAQFCRDKNLCAKYFSLRKKQLGWTSTRQSKVLTKATSTDFIKVSVGKAQSHLSLEVGALKLSWHELPSASWLTDLIKALR